MQQPNHGFYNFSPTFYRDWYEGLLKFEIEGQWVVDHSRNNQMIPPPATQRFKYQGDCSICTLVKRVDNEDSIQYESEWPIQSKYKAMLNA